MLISPEGIETKCAIHLLFSTTNNEAEYEALIRGLLLAQAAGAQSIKAFADSQLIVSQVRGDYEAREARLAVYLQKVKELTKDLNISIEQIGRADNVVADTLSKIASYQVLGGKDSGIIIYQEAAKSVLEEDASASIMEIRAGHEGTWMEPIVKFLTKGVLPVAPQAASKVRRQAPWFVMMEGELMKRGFSHPLLTCVSQEDGLYVIKEIHEGICGRHMGGFGVAALALRQGYYWPTMRKDAQDYVKKCDKCQRFAPFIAQPPAVLQPMVNPIPFAQWGIDILGPFPVATGQRKFLIVAVDYFTKWIEAEPLAKITSSAAKGFLWKNIVTRFGVPRVIIADNGTQFRGDPFSQYCKDLEIALHFSAVAHPQTNGQAEAANK